MSIHKHPTQVWTLCAGMILLAVLASCDPDISEPLGTGNLGSFATAGEAPVIVALGNSLTAGLQSGALYEEFSANSFPTLVARQMGAREFSYPRISYPGLGTGLIELLGLDAQANPILAMSGGLGGSLLNMNHPAPFHNLGVPGATLADLLDNREYSERTHNPLLFVVGRSAQFGATLIEQAAALNPDLLLLMVGSNDALLWAVDGGSGIQFPPPTTPETFAGRFQAIRQNIRSAMPGVVILYSNIPDMLETPFFSTLPWNGLVLGEAQAAALTQAYQQAGLSFTPGANGFVAEAERGPGGIIKMTAGDYLLLTVPQDSLRTAGWGSTKPIPDRYILDAEEAALVRTNVSAYNTAIGSVMAQDGNVIFFDGRAYMDRVIHQGVYVTGSTPITADFISGGFFSYDGIHPSTKGYALVANEILKLINMRYGADIPLVSIPNVPGMPIGRLE